MRIIPIKLLESVADLALLQPGDVICEKRDGMKVVMKSEEGTITTIKRNIPMRTSRSENTGVITEQKLKPTSNVLAPEFYNHLKLGYDDSKEYLAEPPNPEYQARDKILRDAGL